MSEIYLDEKQLAERFGISIHSLQRWRYEGGGPAFVKMGRHIRYPESGCAAWAAARTFTSRAAELAQHHQRAA